MVFPPVVSLVWSNDLLFHPTNSQIVINDKDFADISAERMKVINKAIGRATEIYLGISEEPSIQHVDLINPLELFSFCAPFWQKPSFARKTQQRYEETWLEATTERTWINFNTQPLQRPSTLLEGTPKLRQAIYDTPKIQQQKPRKPPLTSSFQMTPRSGRPTMRPPSPPRQQRQPPPSSSSEEDELFVQFEPTKYKGLKWNKRT
uniref:Uncharacterized protein n=1 Tax=Panagrolaimus superbus TaxID=310955 RepID=A0A914YKT5_9BILA